MGVGYSISWNKLDGNSKLYKNDRDVKRNQK